MFITKVGKSILSNGCSALLRRNPNSWWNSEIGDCPKNCLKVRKVEETNLNSWSYIYVCMCNTKTTDNSFKSLSSRVKPNISSGWVPKPILTHGALHTSRCSLFSWHQQLPGVGVPCSLVNLSGLLWTSVEHSPLFLEGSWDKWGWFFQFLATPFPLRLEPAPFYSSLRTTLYVST